MGRTPTPYSPEPGVKTTNGPPPYYGHPPPPPPPPYRPSTKWFPWLVPTIVIVNIVLFIIAMYINNCPAHSNKCLAVSTLGRFAFQGTHENPLLGPSAATLLKMGALEVKKVVEEHEVWRVVSCMWLHGGTFHLIANMLSFLFVGIGLEQEFGFARVGLLYVISGIGGSLLSALFVRTSISVGASGALFGLLGAMLSELLVNWTIYEDKIESLLSLLLIILINMAVGILPHVDNFAHLGGFVTGFFLGFILMLRPQFGYVSKRKNPGYIGPPSKPKYKAYQCVLLIISTIILVAGFTVGFALLLRGIDGNEHCSWCHYLSCVPTPLWTCEARCTSTQYENQLSLTCMQNHRSKLYILGNDNSTSHVQQLCAQLCG